MTIEANLQGLSSQVSSDHNINGSDKLSLRDYVVQKASDESKTMTLESNLIGLLYQVDNGNKNTPDRREKSDSSFLSISSKMCEGDTLTLESNLNVLLNEVDVPDSKKSKFNH